MVCMEGGKAVSYIKSENYSVGERREGVICGVASDRILYSVALIPHWNGVQVKR